MTHKKALQVAKRANKEFGCYCKLMPFGHNNFRVCTEYAYYYDARKKAQQLGLEARS